MKKTVLITGGTGGLGLATARFLVSQQWQVLVADCIEEKLTPLKDESGLTPIFMDVTDSKSIEQAVEQIQNTVGQLDAVVNFAGILRVGSMAEMPEDVLKLVLDINVMGTFRVNQCCLPLLQKSQGRIINISSETGWQSGGPFNGAYGMSKHAIEAYSDSLRRELQFLGVKVIKIQPGPFKTNMVKGIKDQFSRAVDDSQLFKKQLTKVGTLAVKEQDKAHDPLIIAQTIHKALTLSSPKTAYSVKPDKARCFFEWLPVKWADGLLKLLLK